MNFNSNLEIVKYMTLLIDFNRIWSGFCTASSKCYSEVMQYWFSACNNPNGMEIIITNISFQYIKMYRIINKCKVKHFLVCQ